MILKRNEIKKLFVVNSTEHELYQFIMLNVKMSTIVIIVTFISIINTQSGKSLIYSI